VQGFIVGIDWYLYVPSLRARRRVIARVWHTAVNETSPVSEVYGKYNHPYVVAGVSDYPVLSDMGFVPFRQVLVHAH